MTSCEIYFHVPIWHDCMRPCMHTQLAGNGRLFKLQVGIQSHSLWCD